MALFLLDEATDTGKGANTVVSFLDFFFNNFGLKEEMCHLHADNCVGQNKNNTMLQYLLWRVMTGRHKKITLSFLVAGHTKFAPDACFGLFKRKFRHSKVDCLNDIVEVAKQSSSQNIIIPQLCGTEDGAVLVPIRDWASFLQRWFKRLPGLKKVHHFDFLPSGEVHTKQTCTSEPSATSLLKSQERPDRASLPAVITPPGLSRQRQQYLYDEIRQFVALEHQDTVCPAPAREPVINANPPPTPNNAAAPAPSTSTVLTPAPSQKRVGRPKKTPRGLAAKRQKQS